MPPPPRCGSLIHLWQRWGSLSTLLSYSLSWFKLSHHAFYCVSSSVPAPSTYLRLLLPPPSAPPLLPLPQLHLISLFSSFHATAAIFSPYLEPAILSLSVILRRTPGSFLPERAWSPFPASPPHLRHVWAPAWRCSHLAATTVTLYIFLLSANDQIYTSNLQVAEELHDTSSIQHSLFSIASAVLL